MKTFNFWKANEIAGHFTLNEQELRTRFAKWLKAQTVALVRLEHAVAAFIADVKGLDSVFEQQEVCAICDCLRPVFLSDEKDRILGENPVLGTHPTKGAWKSFEFVNQPKLPGICRLRGARAGTAHQNQDLVWLNGELLELTESLKYVQKSATGFNWGYAGSGPAQLAFAICLRLYGLDIAMRVYQKFKFWFITGIQTDSFDLTIELTEFNNNVIKSYLKPVSW